MADRPGRLIEVTTKVMYVVPDHVIADFGSLDDVIKDWFGENDTGDGYNHRINSHHATRDGMEIGNTKKLISVEEV